MGRMQRSDFYIRPIRPGDYPQVRDIYELGLQTGNASYETQGQSWEQFSRKKIMKFSLKKKSINGANLFSCIGSRFVAV